MANVNVKAVITAEDRASATLQGFSAKTVAIGSAIGSAFGQVAYRAISGVVGQVGEAIKRVDTLKNANRVFLDMGFKATATQSAMKRLNASILGLPTALNDAVSSVELLASATGDVEKGQKIFSAVNDAVIGFGGSTAEAQSAVVQLSQDLAGGVIHASTWNSMLNDGLGPALKAVATQMHLTTAQLRDGLSNGKIGVDQFTDALTKLDTDGGGGMKSFQQIAHDSTSGIGTGFENMKTAVTRGLADIIDAIGQKNISGVLSQVGSDLEHAGKGIAEFINFVTKNKDIFAPLAVGIGAVVTAMIAWNAVTKIATAVQFAFNVVLSANPISRIIMVFIGLASAIIYFATQTQTGQRIFITFGNVLLDTFAAVVGALKAVGGAFVGAFNAVVGVVRTAVNAVKSATGQFGGLLVGAGQSLIQGLIHGAESMVGNLVNTVKGAANSAVDAAKHVLGIHSPSTVFAQIGQNIGLGLAQGVDAVGDTVDKSLGKLVQPQIIMPQAPGGASSAIQPNFGPININFHGPFMGTPAEARKFAQVVADSLKDIAAAKNMTPGQYLG